MPDKSNHVDSNQDKMPSLDTSGDLARVRELYDTERRLAQSISELTITLGRFEREISEVRSYMRSYNNLRSEVNKALEVSLEACRKLEYIEKKDTWWDDVRESIGWVIGFGATLLLIMERMGYLG